ncbi:hypothetical protein GIB67_036223 [Kingdonia uniflora]|uniref:Uncharacterized protein n=1 Tax=Kingdonia uniflora TaxID=39325 RepID=A0A7J7LEW0_9MAGN|nr:hypothetical protein GIB67_036223 [Kingdonia uniflora]
MRSSIFSPFFLSSKIYHDIRASSIQSASAPQSDSSTEEDDLKSDLRVLAAGCCYKFRAATTGYGGLIAKFGGDIKGSGELQAVGINFRILFLMALHVRWSILELSFAKGCDLVHVAAITRRKYWITRFN